MHVVTAADRGYARYLEAFVASIATSPQTRPVELTILTRDFDDALREKIGARIGSPHTVRWVEVSEEALERWGAPKALARLTPHYLRLAMPWALEGVSRAVYIDADTLVYTDLAELDDTDLRGCAVAAVKDSLSFAQVWRENGVPPKTPYFNSGVMVADLVKWRAERIAERVIDVSLEHADRAAQFDQYGLNLVLQGAWTPLAHRWNYSSPHSFTRDVGIVHFVGPFKAHHPACRPAFAARFKALLS